MALKDEAWRLDLENYPMRHTVPTRYADQDENRHLNNVAVALIIQEARVRFNLRVRDSLPPEELNRMMVAHLGIDYIAEGFYPLDVETGVGISRVGRTSYALSIGLFQNGKPFALAEAVMVNLNDAGSAPIGDGLRRGLESLQTTR